MAYSEPESQDDYYCISRTSDSFSFHSAMRYIDSIIIYTSILPVTQNLHFIPHTHTHTQTQAFVYGWVRLHAVKYLPFCSAFIVLTLAVSDE